LDQSHVQRQCAGCEKPLDLAQENWRVIAPPCPYRFPASGSNEQSVVPEVSGPARGAKISVVERHQVDYFDIL
jgi:hypothetical protein